MSAPAARRPAPTTVPMAPQGGVLNRPQEHLLLAALTINAPQPSDAAAIIESLRKIVHAELTSDLAVDGESSSPPAETGELGYELHHDRDHLTITVGFSSSAYAKLGVTQPPADLVTIPWAQLGDAPVTPDGGDIVVQICADNAFVCEHALRRIEHTLTGQITVNWAHTGAQRYNSRPGRTARREGRSWIGFLDGTSNLAPRNNVDDQQLTFVDPAAVTSYPRSKQDAPPPVNPYAPGNPLPAFPGDLREPPSAEPDWTRYGTYMAARVSVNDLASWDATPLSTQEQVIGRTKVQGTSLDLPADAGPDAVPAFAADQTNAQVAVTAHVRKANPRTPADLARRIFRRGYPLYEGTDNGLRRGLVFIAFGRTLSTQFEFITRAWLNNPNFPFVGAGPDQLKAFDTTVLAGGYYFVPGLTNRNQPWTWIIPAAPSPASPPTTTA